jgi:hypothetical protein
MKTAIIVSGILRETKIASSSWKFDADYFLFTQNTYQAPRKYNKEHCIIKDLESVHEKFKAVCMIDRLNTEHEFLSTIVNQTWKWKIAYNFLLSYIEQEQYTRFILIRPDLFFRFNSKSIDEINFEPNVCYSTSPIITNPDGLKFSNDTWMAFDQAVFQKLSQFYDYLKDKNFAITNIHNDLADYFQSNNIKVNNRLLELGECFVLRKEVNYMFEDSCLKDKYSYNDLAEELIAWNNHKKSTYPNE